MNQTLTNKEGRGEVSVVYVLTVFTFCFRFISVVVEVAPTIETAESRQRDVQPPQLHLNFGGEIPSVQVNTKCYTYISKYNFYRTL